MAPLGASSNGVPQPHAWNWERQQVPRFAVGTGAMPERGEFSSSNR